MKSHPDIGDEEVDALFRELCKSFFRARFCNYLAVLFSEKIFECGENILVVIDDHNLWLIRHKLPCTKTDKSIDVPAVQGSRKGSKQGKMLLQRKLLRGRCQLLLGSMKRRNWHSKKRNRGRVQALGLCAGWPARRAWRCGRPAGGSGASSGKLVPPP